MKHQVVQLYYTITELAVLLKFSDATIRRKLKAGEFSPPGQDAKPDFTNLLEDGGDIRIPTTGVFYYIENHPYRRSPGIEAKNKEDLQRKLRGVRTSE